MNEQGGGGGRKRSKEPFGEKGIWKRKLLYTNLNAKFNRGSLIKDLKVK